MNTCTNLQKYLQQRIVPWKVIRERLDIDRSLPGKWARGSLYPNRFAGQKLISLFAEYGVSLDYNDLYQHQDMDKAS